MKKIMSKAEFKNSYFLRDLTVAYLESPKLTTRQLSERVRKFLRLSFCPRQTIINSIGLWIGSDSVVCYLTEKKILYSLRGDYI